MPYEMLKNNYGKELILDLIECDISNFNRPGLTKFFEELVDLLEMEASDLHFWDYDGIPEEERDTEPHLLGTSAVQFITTSNITIHTLDLKKEVYLNVFSCKDFDDRKAARFCIEFFGAKETKASVVMRG